MRCSTLRKCPTSTPPPHCRPPPLRRLPPTYPPHSRDTITSNRTRVSVAGIAHHVLTVFHLKLTRMIYLYPLVVRFSLSYNQLDQVLSLFFHLQSIVVHRVTFSGIFPSVCVSVRLVITLLDCSHTFIFSTLNLHVWHTCSRNTLVM